MSEGASLHLHSCTIALVYTRSMCSDGARVWVRYAQVHHEIGARGYAAQATISLVSLEAGFRLGNAECS